MRPTGLSSPAYKDEIDFVIYDMAKPSAGYTRSVASPDIRWFWSMTLLIDWRLSMVTSGKVATLEERRLGLRRAWRRHAAMTRLEQRGAFALAGRAAAIGVMLQVTVWGYLF
jgi:hypothetical protein